MWGVGVKWSFLTLSWFVSADSCFHNYIKLSWMQGLRSKYISQYSKCLVNSPCDWNIMQSDLLSFLLELYRILFGEDFYDSISTCFWNQLYLRKGFLVSYFGFTFYFQDIIPHEWKSVEERNKRARNHSIFPLSVQGPWAVNSHTNTTNLFNRYFHEKIACNSWNIENSVIKLLLFFTFIKIQSLSAHVLWSLLLLVPINTWL